MPTFRSPHNPNFKLSPHTLGRTIIFTDGNYSTEDPEELRALRRSESVDEVPDKPAAPATKVATALKDGGVVPRAASNGPIQVHAREYIVPPGSAKTAGPKADPDDEFGS